ncbi:MAG: hypothetical protein ABIR06_14610 [Cyclobacteriaceae bacterium]
MPGVDVGLRPEDPTIAEYLKAQRNKRSGYKGSIEIREKLGADIEKQLDLLNSTQ